jgi:tetratricopeptide (TPR) repeat protein
MNFLLGQKLVKQKEFGKALNIFLNLKKNQDKDIRIFFYLGIIYFELNDFNKSIFFYLKYLKKEPNSKNALLNLAIVKQSIGEIDEAKKIYLKLIDIDESKLKPYFGLLTLDENYLTDKDYININKIKKSQNLSLYEKGIVSFILSKKEKKNKNFKKEIEYLKDFHLNIFNSNYDYNISSQFYYEHVIKQKYNKIEFINKNKNHYNHKFQPIFIIGLPRSGSTLIESILTSGVKKIKSCGESHVINTTILEQIGPKIYTKSFDIKKFIFQIDNNIFQDTVLNKYSNFNVINDKENYFFIDKSLENFFNIDIILNSFPKAKFLHTFRNSTDSIISIYQSMLPELSWTHSIDDILNYIENYHKVISYFKLKYPNKILDISLEEFTEKNEKITKKIYKFCDLKWNKNVLEFYKRDDLYSKTLSFSQIRKKITDYNKKKYKSYFNLLNEYQEKYKWININ